MKKAATIMGMPVSIHIIGDTLEPIRQAQGEKDIEEVFNYLRHIDDVFSTYKETSEIHKINTNLLLKENVSNEVKIILELCEQTKRETNGYFDIQKNGEIDPSGIVKGYAIHESAEVLKRKGYTNFSVEIAGDAELIGKNEKGEKWQIGIQNPFDTNEIIKVIELTNKGIATSGNYLQNHIYNPFTGVLTDEIASITVIGPNVYEADRFATAAFAMGENGILFIEKQPALEGYMVTKEKKAIMTSEFEKYVI